MSPAVDWQTTIIAVAIGLAGGLLLVFYLWRSRAAASALAPIEVRDLEAQRDVLLGQLRELGDEAEKLTPGQTQAERARLELACARVLRDLDRRPATRPAPAPRRAAEPTHGTWGHWPALRGFVWGVVVVSSVAALFVLASRSATRREPDPSAQMADATTGEDAAALEELKEAVVKDPTNLEARLNLARAHLMRHEMMEVFKETRFVLERDPKNSRALSYQALVRFAMGEGDRALSMLRQALDNDPDLLDGWIHLIYVEAQLGRLADAERSLAAATKRHPEHAQALRGLLDEIRKQPVASPAPVMVNPHAALDRPAAKAEGGRSVSGTITLGPGVAAGPGGVVFVVVRPAGVAQGTPVAAKRLDPEHWPLAFTLSPADSMMGAPLPARMRIEARLDRDGDIASRDAREPLAVADNVALGQEGLGLVLKTR
jgi:tetratricopeptide (TPR) repeat protein